MTENNNTLKNGTLHLVSIGCGDFENITMRAYRIIREADVIVTTRTCSDELVELLKGKEVIEGSLAIYGNNGMMMPGAPKDQNESMQPKGKLFADAKPKFMMGPMPKEKLEALQKDLKEKIGNAVHSGKRVVVLDGGDPALFGPQASNLNQFAELNPVVVPGVSCLGAANAMLRTGVVGGGCGCGAIILSKAPWAELGETCEFSDPDKTVVFFTMRSNFTYTIEQLKKRYPVDTPIAITLCAGYDGKERVVQGTLSDIESQINPAELPFEHLIYVGNFLKNRF